MKIINLEPKGKDRLEMPEWMRSLVAGRQEGQDAAAIEIASQALQASLDNRFVLLSNLKLEGLEVPIPMVLVGPPGVWVLYPSVSAGVYRAKEDEWEILDDRQKEYKPARPNLMVRVRLMTQVIDAYLDTNGFPVEVIEPALVFTNPGTHVEQIQPDVRIVLMDAIDRFSAGLLQSLERMTADEIERVVHILAPEVDQGGEVQDVDIERDSFSFSDDGTPRKTQVSPALSDIDQMVDRLLKKVPFSKEQWILLTVMVVVNILLLTAFVVLILLTS